MIRYGELLREIRMLRGLRQIDIAKIHNISNFSYSSIERGRFNPTAPTVKALQESTFYTTKEKESLDFLYKDIVNEQKKNIDNKEYLKKISKQKQRRVRKIRQVRKEERLIRNNPNFYKKLNSLGDLKNVDINDPKLQDIRESVSGKRYWKGES